jgi:hypothetical protein
VGADRVQTVSGKGNRYLIGRMGGVRVMVLEYSRREGDDDNTHTLMFAEAPQYDAARSQFTPAERCAQRGGEKQQMDDDPVPF